MNKRFKILKRKEKSLIQVRLGQLFGTHNLHKKECSREGTFSTGHIWFIHKELQIIMTRDIPESFRLCCMFLLCARLYNLTLWRFFSFFSSLCLQCSFSILFCFDLFLTKQTYNVWGRNRAHTVRFCRVLLTLVNI